MCGQIKQFLLALIGVLAPASIEVQTSMRLVEKFGNRRKMKLSIIHLPDSLTAMLLVSRRSSLAPKVTLYPANLPWVFQIKRNLCHGVL